MRKKQMNPAKVVLITGAARRIGAEIARVLHEAGLNVVLHYHTSRADIENLCTVLNEKRAHSAIMLSADLLNASHFNTLVKDAVQAFGQLDVLVNNASRFYRTEMGAVTELAWDDLLGCNLKAPFFLSQAAAPYLAQQQGCIVNITDVHGERPMRDYSAYCISKAGLIMLTKSLAKELGPRVRVNAVSPGAIMWPEGNNTMSAADKQKVVQRTVLRQEGNPQDIAQAVLFFVNAADYVTGQVLAVDGGRSLMI